MRRFLFPRHPLPRATLLRCHLLLQLGLLGYGLSRLLPRTPWLADTTWVTAWPDLALGGGLLLLAMAAMRLLLELWLLPYHLPARQGGFAPQSVMTRSDARRPAVHDPDSAWTSEARRVVLEDEVVGKARVRRTASEPTLDVQDGLDEAVPSGEPRLS
ncbi:hypothetical protein PRZ61_16755 [Halomonas pacifica]|uniref:hypothetical protein n=1 Tax=Bisbaumannia pacifica TaxID=77098 RepID=UPI0023580D3B|nr:hypothetical protein [Halomonas pacifica]MDC8805104.1 hypothetical protein [Halomonas pacifica]